MSANAGSLKHSQRARIATVAVLALALAGCNMGGLFNRPAPAATVAPTVAINLAELPGAWGFASYHTATDRERTEAQAKLACSNPYRIGQGASGGVTMYPIDQAEPQEVFLKVAPDGRSFLGPTGAPGMPQDRLIVSYENGVLITDWVDPAARQRYGTMVLVRCSAPA